MSTKASGYMAVRKTEGREWLDFHTLAVLPEITKRQMSTYNEMLPAWAKDNPVTRIARVVIEEVKEGATTT